jgi:alpha-glucosidase (family GH31 glycosyl hydrolase)
MHTGLHENIRECTDNTQVILGNWWSRYWKYSDKELKELMLEFKNRSIPLSVCIVDMDWHIVENKYSAGWTGYTWNRELFPEPEKFMKFIHGLGLKTALNLHPASGVHPHEERYSEMAEFMGIDPKSEKPVEFDVTDPKFINGYFNILHHPLEDQGVDFWWMDWQQGTNTKMANLDPLFLLNHLHFYDLGRDGVKRPFVFSRFSGMGSQRYPIGFSGDTVVSWESLKFQPYFTLTASNAAYGWWSHDIGGHMFGTEDSELYTRWVQLGVFSPILRIHSTNNPYQDRRPWNQEPDAYEVIKNAMNLRHAFIPYLYAMAWETTEKSIPLIRPMYYYHPENERSYGCKNQYYFGSQ